MENCVNRRVYQQAIVLLWPFIVAKDITILHQKCPTQWMQGKVANLESIVSAYSGRQVVAQVKKVGKSRNFHQKVGKSRKK